MVTHHGSHFTPAVYSSKKANGFHKINIFVMKITICQLRGMFKLENKMAIIIIRSSVYCNIDDGLSKHLCTAMWWHLLHICTQAMLKKTPRHGTCLILVFYELFILFNITKKTVRTSIIVYIFFISALCNLSSGVGKKHNYQDPLRKLCVTKSRQTSSTLFVRR